MNAADILRYGSRTLMQAIEGLAVTYWDVPALGTWTVKDIMAHMTCQEQVLADVLAGFSGDGPTPHLIRYLELGHKFDEVRVAEYRGVGVEGILADYNQAHARVMEAITRIPPEVLRRTETLPWYGAEYSLDDYIVYASYGHKREHSAHIGMFRDRLKAEQPATAQPG